MRFLADEAISVPGSDDCIVLADRMATTDRRGNLMRLRPDGSEVWRLDAPSGVGDLWTEVRLEGDEVIANSWSGTSCGSTWRPGKSANARSRSSAELPIGAPVLALDQAICAGAAARRPRQRRRR
jgi:hypothetical protein